MIYKRYDHVVDEVIVDSTEDSLMKLNIKWNVFETWHWSKLKIIPIILRQTRKMLSAKHQNLFRRYLLYTDSYTDRLMFYIIFPILLERRREDKIKEKRMKE